VRGAGGGGAGGGRRQQRREAGAGPAAVRCGARTLLSLPHLPRSVPAPCPPRARPVPAHSSWAKMDATASVPGSPLGEGLDAPHETGHFFAGLPTQEYLTLVLDIVRAECLRQGWVFV
jgi:hypothetical protein